MLEMPSPKWKARTVVWRVMPSRSDNGTMIGIVVTAIPVPEVSEDIHDILEGEHAQDLHGTRQFSDDSGQAIDDCVDDAAFVQYDDDAPGKADNEGAIGDGFGSFDEFAGDAARAVSGTEATDDTHAQEQGSQFLDPPALL